MTQTIRFEANTTWQQVVSGPASITLNPELEFSYMYIGASAPTESTTDIFLLKPVAGENYLEVTLESGDSIFLKALKEEGAVVSYIQGAADGSSGGGSGNSAPSQVEVTNFPASQAVTGPITNAQFTAVQGTAATAEWTGTGNATTIAILKALYTQNQQVITLLGEIANNTANTV